MRDADDGNTYGACLLLLWLKAVYWDSGVVATPKETALKLYEALPNIERPDLHDIRE